MAAESSTKISVYAALAGNILVALTKAVAAAWTGSSAMLSEAVHSFVDTGNEGLLLYGMHRASVPPDPVHPLGHGRELYFWSFIVALLIFALGAAVSIYQGVLRVMGPGTIEDPIVSYVVLALAFVFEGVSWIVALRQFRNAKGSQSYYEGFRRSKDPASFLTFFEDTAALLGIVVAAIGTFAASSLDLPIADGIASILIGLILGITSLLLTRESKSLLIGERADGKLAESILRLAAENPAVASANGVITIHLAPRQIVAALSLDFVDTLRADELQVAVIAIEKRVRSVHSEVMTLFVKPQTEEVYRDTLRRRYGADASDRSVDSMHHSEKGY